MPITRIQSYDTGAGYYIQIERDLDGELIVSGSRPGSFLFRLGVDGTAATIAPYAQAGNLVYGSLTVLGDGSYLVAGTNHSGLGWGVRTQVIDRNGVLVTDILNPAFEDGEDRNLAGWTVAAGPGSGYYLAWNDISRSGDITTVTFPPAGDFGYTSYDARAGMDVRFRFFDGDGAALTPSIITDDDVEMAGDASASRRAGDQMVQDSQALVGGKVATVYLDTRAVGGPAERDGFHNEMQLSLVIAAVDGSTEPVKVDITPFNQTGGLEYTETLVNGTAYADVVALPDGTLAVVWNELSYVYDPSVWLNYRYTGTDTLVRYYDANGNALTDAIELFHRGTDMGNISKRVFADSLGDGRIVLAWNDGVYGVNGNGSSDAFMGIVGARGTAIETSRVNAQAAENTQGYGVQDLAVRTDGTIEIAYNDAHRQENGYNANRTVIDRFTLGTGFNGVVRAGADGSDDLAGGNRDDQIAGLGGDDIIHGLRGNDEIFGNLGVDRLYGDDGADRLYGNEGDDVLEGGGGADALYGGDGLDSASYAASSSAIQINLATGERRGGDTGGDTFVSIEGLIGTRFNDVLTGDDVANRLDGGTGNDTLTGGKGDDLYLVDSKRDVIVELAGEGTDTVHAGYSYVLAPALEDLVLEGDGAISGTGNAANNAMTGTGAANLIKGQDGDDVLYGLGGNDTLYGGAGFDLVYGGEGDDRIYYNGGGDRLYGGAGNDQYVVSGDSSAQVYEEIGGGVDTVRVSTNFYAFGMNEIENIILVGTAGVAHGSDTDNRITGNNGGNWLVGNGGSDVILGNGGDDALDGGTGDDTLVGGRGRDNMRGGAGADSFLFYAGDTSRNRELSDIIIDFSNADGDRIGLSRIDAVDATAEDNRFSFIGTAAFSNVAGQLRYEQEGGNTFVMGDTDGDGRADLQIQLNGLIDLTARDFQL